MSEFALTSGDMSAAASAVQDAAEAARGRDGSGALPQLANGLEGSTTAEVAGQLVTPWVDGVRAWTDNVLSVAAAIERLRDEAGVTDAEAAERLVLRGPR